jgi:hypothetical protein
LTGVTKPGLARVGRSWRQSGLPLKKHKIKIRFLLVATGKKDADGICVRTGLPGCGPSSAVSFHHLVREKPTAFKLIS